MKNKTILILSLMMMFITSSCVKEPEVIVDTPVIVSEVVNVGNTNARFDVTYEYTTKLKSVWINIGTSPDNLDNPKNASIIDKTFTATVSSLSMNQTYYYNYYLYTSIGYVETEVKSFRTPKN